MRSNTRVFFGFTHTGTFFELTHRNFDIKHLQFKGISRLSPQKTIAIKRVQLKDFSGISTYIKINIRVVDTLNDYLKHRWLHHLCAYADQGCGDLFYLPSLHPDRKTYNPYSRRLIQISLCRFTRQHIGKLS